MAIPLLFCWAVHAGGFGLPVPFDRSANPYGSRPFSIYGAEIQSFTGGNAVEKQKFNQFEDKLIGASSMISMLAGMMSPLDCQTGREGKPLDLTDDERHGFTSTLYHIKDVIDETCDAWQTAIGSEAHGAENPKFNQFEDKLIQTSSVLSMLAGMTSPLDYQTGREGKPLDLTDDERQGFTFTLYHIKDVIDEVCNAWPPVRESEAHRPVMFDNVEGNGHYL